MSTKKKSNRKRHKFTGSARITLVALSLVSFVSSWNLIARIDGKNTQANDEGANPTTSPVTTSSPAVTIPSVTWSSINPLPTWPSIPSLSGFQQAAGSQTPANNQVGSTPTIDLGSLQIAPLPTLAPLPSMPEPPPPPPPVSISNGGGNNQSGGS